jgi:hypothetical protein
MSERDDEEDKVQMGLFATQATGYDVPPKCTSCEHCKPTHFALFHILTCDITGQTIVSLHASDLPKHWEGHRLLEALRDLADREAAVLLEGKPGFCPYITGRW